MILASKSKEFKGKRVAVVTRYNAEYESIDTDIHFNGNSKVLLKSDRCISGKLPTLPKRFRRLLSDEEVSQIKEDFRAINRIGAKYGIC